MKPCTVDDRPITRKRRRLVQHMGPYHKQLFMRDLCMQLAKIAIEKDDPAIDEKISTFEPWAFRGKVDGIKNAMADLLLYYDGVIRDYYHADIEDLSHKQNEGR